MFGSRIKEIRLKNNLTQKKLARLLGYKSPSAIVMIENDEREIKTEALLKMSSVFNVSIDYLLGKTDTPATLVVKNDELPDVMKPFLKSNSEMTIELDGDNFGTPEERKKAIEDGLKGINAYDYASELSKLLDLLPEDKKGNPISVYDLYYLIGNNKDLLEKLESDDMIQESCRTYTINNTPHYVEALKTIPSEFTSPAEARKYISMHQIFAAEGFNVNKMSDEDILDFANSLLEQMKMVGYKYKK